MPPESIAIMALFYVVFLFSRGWSKSRAPKELAPPPDPPETRGEKVRRVLKHVRRSSIATLQEGDAAVIEGYVRALPRSGPLTSPLAHAPCLGFHLDVRLLAGDWRVIQLHEVARCVDFEIVDQTGAMVVSAQGLELAITRAPEHHLEPPYAPEIAAFIPQMYHYHPVTMEEGLLVPGMRILVCGVATRELTATDYRDGGSRLVLRASQTFPLVASTDEDLFTPGDRPFAPEELRRGRGGSGPAGH